MTGCYSKRGPRGCQGPPGRDGCDGRDGCPGKDGCRGPKGCRGPPGRDGCSGRDGCRGPRGCRGPKGCRGPPGRDGCSGRDGCRGPPGKDGCDGRDGCRGPPGKDGCDGRDGCRGPRGYTGPPGPPGKDGCDGLSGKGCCSVRFIRNACEGQPIYLSCRDSEVFVTGYPQLILPSKYVGECVPGKSFESICISVVNENDNPLYVYSSIGDTFQNSARSDGDTPFVACNGETIPEFMMDLYIIPVGYRVKFVKRGHTWYDILTEIGQQNA